MFEDKSENKIQSGDDSGCKSGGTSGDLDFTTLMDRLDGDRSLFLEIVPIFLDDVIGRIERIDQAVSTRNNDQIVTEAHTIKGSAGTMAARNLQEASRELEMAARREEDVTDRVQQVKCCFQRLRQCLIDLIEECSF